MLCPGSNPACSPPAGAEPTPSLLQDSNVLFMGVFVRNCLGLLAALVDLLSAIAPVGRSHL